VMGEVRNHKDLEVWKVSMDFVVEIYALTKSFPSAELYGLTGQLRRAAVSIPSNLAEGATRKNTKEFIQFLYIAKGSLSEIETQLMIAERLKYFTDSKLLFDKIQYLRTLISRLITALNKKLNP
jgi:four helix bundle protein